MIVIMMIIGREKRQRGFEESSSFEERFDNDDEVETAVDKDVHLMKKGWSENRSFVARDRAYHNKM